ncbi:hypothetical protein BAE44_0022093 [Dichanthelium oligosanthes]|uniref:Uncharacterized protein n=1 Tax=Dichanthelium oligosanthes TaxID=888268 RepID=A0A1E5UVP5_9POAL|nr:hypothetical protein BAE44_0022093 [Dichanthelium oligosanthes]
MKESITSIPSLALGMEIWFNVFLMPPIPKALRDQPDPGPNPSKSLTNNGVNANHEDMEESTPRMPLERMELQFPMKGNGIQLMKFPAPEKEINPSGNAKGGADVFHRRAGKAVLIDHMKIVRKIRGDMEDSMLETEAGRKFALVFSELRNIPFYLLTKKLAHDLGESIGTTMKIYNNVRRWRPKFRMKGCPTFACFAAT